MARCRYALSALATKWVALHCSKWILFNFLASCSPSAHSWKLYFITHISAEIQSHVLSAFSKADNQHFLLAYCGPLSISEWSCCAPFGGVVLTCEVLLLFGNVFGKELRSEWWLLLQLEIWCFILLLFNRSVWSVKISWPKCRSASLLTCSCICCRLKHCPAFRFLHQHLGVTYIPSCQGMF